MGHLPLIHNFVSQNIYCRRKRRLKNASIFIPPFLKRIEVEVNFFISFLYLLCTVGGKRKENKAVHFPLLFVGCYTARIPCLTIKIASFVKQGKHRMKRKPSFASFLRKWIETLVNFSI